MKVWADSFFVFPGTYPTIDRAVCQSAGRSQEGGSSGSTYSEVQSVRLAIRRSLESGPGPGLCLSLVRRGYCSSRRWTLAEAMRSLASNAISVGGRAISRYKFGISVIIYIRSMALIAMFCVTLSRWSRPPTPLEIARPFLMRFFEGHHASDA